MEFFLGQIALFAFNFTPEGWAPCEGQSLPMASNQALFALLGVTYGGDGRTIFSRPNLKGKEPIPGLHYCIATTGLFPSRQ